KRAQKNGDADDQNEHDTPTMVAPRATRAAAMHSSGAPGRGPVAPATIPSPRISLESLMAEPATEAAPAPAPEQEPAPPRDDERRVRWLLIAVLLALAAAIAAVWLNSRNSQRELRIEVAKRLAAVEAAEAAGRTALKESQEALRETQAKMA